MIFYKLNPGILLYFRVQWVQYMFVIMSKLNFNIANEELNASCMFIRLAWVYILGYTYTIILDGNFKPYVRGRNRE